MSDLSIKAIDVQELQSRERVKAIMNIPGWLSGDQSVSKDKITGSAAAYELVPLIYRAVKLRCDAISSVPIHVFRGQQEVDWPFKAAKSELIWRTEAALLLRGMAVWLKKPNTQNVQDVQWLNPYTLEVEWGQNTGLVITQSQATDNTGPWTFEKVVYFKEFSPIDDLGPGTAAAAVSLEDARLLRYLTRFAARYFENGAMPVTLLGFEYTPSADETKRVESWFRRRASGIANAWRVLALRGKIDPKVLTPPPKDLEMKELNNQARHNIAMAFGIPQTMLEDAANYATAGEHRLSFWQDTVRPRGRIYEDVLNSQLFKGMGLQVQFNFEEMGVFQVDEAERSGALVNLTEAGFDPLTAAEQLGYQLTDEQRRRIEEKARGLLIDGSSTSDGKSQSTAQSANTAQDDPSTPDGKTSSSAQGDDLKMWERKALKRLKAGKKALVGFESEAIEDSLRGAIEGALDAAEGVEDVKWIFGDALRSSLDPSDEAWRGYP